MYYLDTSAAVKMLMLEEGSSALRSWLTPRAGQIFSSDLLRTELLRATRRTAPELMEQARTVLDSVTLVTISTGICERAAMLEPSVLRSPDALHLAAARELGDDLQGLITYDRALAESARMLGVEVITPRSLRRLRLEVGCRGGNGSFTPSSARSNQRRGQQSAGAPPLPAIRGSRAPVAAPRATPRTSFRSPR